METLITKFFGDPNISFDQNNGIGILKKKAYVTIRKLHRFLATILSQFRGSPQLVLLFFSNLRDSIPNPDSVKSCTYAVEDNCRRASTFLNSGIIPSLVRKIRIDLKIHLL